MMPVELDATTRPKMSSQRAKSDSPAPITAIASVSMTERVVGTAIIVALLGSALMIDPWAEAGFDAPKRLLAVSGAAVAGAALLFRRRHADTKTIWPKSARWIVGLSAVGGLGLLIATMASPHRDASMASLRLIALFALFLPIGASRVFDGPLARRLWQVAAIAIVINALLSIAQSAGWSMPLPIEKIGGRFPTGALLGNEGYVALACSLMCAACLAFALNGSTRRQRVVAIGLGVIGIVAIAVNMQLTSAIAVIAAVVAILAVRWQRRWLVTLGVVMVLLATTTAIVPGLRNISWGALPVAGVDGYQQLTTHRVGAWAAALEMIEARPLTGFGPGSYAAESQSHRLAAELKLRERLLPPAPATTFVHAHNDYLQLAAEAGVPTLLALMAALGMLIFGLLQRARSPGRAEPLAVLGILVAGAVAALAWFPLQMPLTAVVLLLACGRGWRLLVADEDDVP